MYNDSDKVFKSLQYNTQWNEITPPSIREGYTSTPFRKDNTTYLTNNCSSDTVLIEDSETHKENPQ
jgi:hypothetical protein